MKPDEPTPPAGQPTPETPPASLTAVRIGRRKAAAPASGKAGDLTQQLGSDGPADGQASAPPDPAAASMPPVAPAAPPVRAAAQPPTAKPAPALAPEPPRAAAPAPATKPTRAAAPVAPAEPPRAATPPSDKSARLLGEDEIRQLLDPPERRAAAKQPAAPPATAAASGSPAASVAPPPAASGRPVSFAPPPQAPTPPAPALAPAPPVVEPTPPTAIKPPPLTLEPDEREAVPAAPELRLVAETPTSSAKVEAPAERPSATALPTTIDQIIDYWDNLRGGKPVPSLEALDRGLVRRSWPNCMLVAYGGAPKLTRIGEENGEIEYLEMVIHWILSRGQIAASRGEPMEEEKRFPVSDGNARYQLLLLPLANAEGKSEHVLCHLLRVKEAAKPKGFKRWLAS